MCPRDVFLRGHEVAYADTGDSRWLGLEQLAASQHSVTVRGARSIF